MVFILKVLISGFIVAAASLIAKKHPGPAGIIVALPITTFLTMAWMGVEGTSSSEMATFLQSVGWITIAGVGLFFITPWLIRLGYGFWPSFAAGLATLALGTWVAARFAS